MLFKRSFCEIEGEKWHKKSLIAHLIEGDLHRKSHNGNGEGGKKHTVAKNGTFHVYRLFANAVGFEEGENHSKPESRKRKQHELPKI